MKTKTAAPISSNTQTFADILNKYNVTEADAKILLLPLVAQSANWDEAVERCATLCENFHSEEDIYNNFPYRPLLVTAVRSLKTTGAA